jgi:hypothetical protein
MKLIYILRHKIGTFPLANCPLKLNKENWSIYIYIYIYI